MPRALKLITAPAENVLTLAEAKDQVRFPSAETADDAAFTEFIRAAQDLIESGCGLQLVTATWELELDGFASRIVLPRPPLQSVSQITYTDTDGDEQTVDTDVYGFQNPLKTPGTVYLKSGKGWPTDVSSDPGSVRVRFVCGYGSASAVPGWAKTAARMLVGHFYENREATVPGMSITELPLGVQTLMSSHSIGVLSP